MTGTKSVAIPSGTPPEDALALLAAQRGAEGSRERVRALLAREPAWIERLGTLASEAESALLSQVGGQVLVQESVRAEMARMRDGLVRTADGALECLLVERVLLCWLNVTLAELRRAERGTGDRDPAATEFWDRHVSRADADFQRACRTLATLRRLRLPTVQVNLVKRDESLGRRA